MDKNAKVFTTASILRSILSSYITLSFVFLIVVFGDQSASGQAVTFDPIERRLIEWTDAREHADSLASYLVHKDPDVAWRAAIGLANLEDSNSRHRLISALEKESRPRERDAIAFAIGVLGENVLSTNALHKAIASAPSKVLLEALGRVAPLTDLRTTIKLLLEDPQPIVLDALITLALRKAPIYAAIADADLKDEFSEEILPEWADSENRETRWKTAYLLSRIEDSLGTIAQLPTIRALLLDLGEPLTRMFAASALAKVHNRESDELLIRTFKAEREWRVRTNILHALGRSTEIDSAILQVFGSAIFSSTETDLTSQHVAATSLSVLDQIIQAGKISTRDSSRLREVLMSFMPRRGLYPLVPMTTRASVLQPLARLDSPEIGDFIIDVTSLPGRHNREQAIKAIAIFDDSTGFIGTLRNMAYANDREQQVSLEALHTLWERAKKHPKILKELEDQRYAMAYRRMLLRLPGLTEDAATVVTALEHLKDSVIMSPPEIRAEAAQFLPRYLHRFSTPRHQDQLLATIDVLKWMGQPTDSARIELLNVYNYAAASGNSPLFDSITAAMRAMDIPFTPAVLMVTREPIDWAMLESQSDTVLISTERGQMMLRLDKFSAPLTSLNFLKLSKINYFANNIFHRVVSNFVIQAGDPTQSGWGGPGYAIRREVAPVRYDKAGMVGMASSGKDTEGSQWFITHLPTPHLDARYTIFGEIVSGGEAIDQIQLYDRISNVFQMTK